LEQLLRKGKVSTQTLTHARILLKADAQTGWTDERIHHAFDVSVATIERVRRRYVQHGLAAALQRQKQVQSRTRRLDGRQEAHLIALACSPPPEGHARWTLRLLADRMVALEYVDDLSHETVRRTLKKTNSSRG
jgi:transposase